jgi:molybdopterin converting factor small subunit
MCEIEFYGMIAEKLEKSKDSIEIDNGIAGKNVSEWILEQYPVLKGMTFKCAINGVLSEKFNEGQVLKIAVLPPFAGG